MGKSWSDLVGQEISINKKDGNGQTVKGKVVHADAKTIHVETGPAKVEEILVEDIHGADDLFPRWET